MDQQLLRGLFSFYKKIPSEQFAIGPDVRSKLRSGLDLFPTLHCHSKSYVVCVLSGLEQGVLVAIHWMKLWPFCLYYFKCIMLDTIVRLQRHLMNNKCIKQLVGKREVNYCTHCHTQQYSYRRPIGKQPFHFCQESMYKTDLKLM